MSKTMEKPIMARMKCPKCNAVNEASSVGITVLSEAALFICPVCNSQYNLTAVLKEIGEKPGEEATPEEFQPSELPAPPETKPAAEAPAAPPPPPPPEESVKPLVISCTNCIFEWVASYAERCPRCGSTKILASSKTIQDRVAGAFAEVDRGVPAPHAVDNLLGVVIGA